MYEVNARDRVSGLHIGERLMDRFDVTALAPAPS
jgi:hypothetical protein